MPLVADILETNEHHTRSARADVKLHEMKIPKSAVSKSNKRRGQGAASGIGGTAGRGHKGQKACSGGKVRRGFEGGQMPLVRRVPKRGFTSLFPIRYEVVNVADIAGKGLEGEITPEVLKAAGLVRKSTSRVKILGEGDIQKALNIKAHAFSRSAKEKIVNAGGTAEEL
jgi:large subunit ribosomal protein L15